MYQVFVWRVLQPFPLLWLFLGFALLNLWRKRTESRRRLLLVAFPFVVLTIISLPAVGDLAVGSLERQYPPLLHRPDGVQAIVVLSSYMYPPSTPGAAAEFDESTCNRCCKAADMYRQGNSCPIVVSGMSADPNGADYGAAMRDFLVQLGVRADHVIVEGHSLTTYENAVESCKLLQARQLSRILLVTDATHMKRAAGCFRKQGLEVIPCGAMYRRHDTEFEFSRLIPQPGVADRCQRICHEWLGLAWYWWRGRI
jgi:uncharacterized SAM-binding protein YcdF (DUF218 family)